MARYRNKTVECEAVQWTGSNREELLDLCTPFDFDDDIDRESAGDSDATAAVRESEHGTWVGLLPGDWVVRRGVELDRVAASEFERWYEPVPAEPDSPAYARLKAAAHEATEAAHLHAMHGMRAVYQLCRQYGFGDERIPAVEVLAALGLDEHANPVGPRQDGAQPS